MRPETRTKLFSAVKKKTFLGVLLAMSAGHSYAVEDPDQPKATETEQTAVKVQATENEKQQVKENAAELKPAMITIPQEKLFEVITARAKKLASEPYVAPKELELEALTSIGYQDYRAIRFRTEQAIWKDQSLYEVQLFHPGFLYRSPVAINTLEQNAEVKSLPFKTDYYRYDATAAPLEQEISTAIANTQLGHAGFRLHFPLNNNQYKDEVAVFQGASYFRLVGPHQVYGLSARGLAVDTALSSGEEFPVFKEFWLVKPAPEDTTIVLYALLDSPSVSGAYRFELTPSTNTEVKTQMQIFRD